MEVNPGQATEALLRIGATGLQVEELFSLEALDESHHISALVLLYKWFPAEHRSDLEYYDPQLVHWRQALNRPMLPQAILAAVLNGAKGDIGEALGNLKETLMPLDSVAKTQALSNSPVLHALSQFLGESSGHYSIYVPLHTRIYELSGLAEGPICVGEFQDEDWTDHVKRHLTKRLAEFSEYQVQFSLLAVSLNRKEVAAKKMAALQSQIGALRVRLSEEQDSELQAELQSDLEQKEAALKEHSQVMSEEEDRARKWTQEASWRKHNYVPFILRMLQKLESKGLFPAAIKAAHRRAEQHPEQEA